MLTSKLLTLALTGTEWIIWLLTLLSIVSLAVIMEKLWTLHRKKSSADFEARILSLLKRKDQRAIEEMLAKDGSAMAAVALKTVRNMQDKGISFEDSLSISLSEEKMRLESRIAILGTLGSNAPFVGLFGTVLGIIHAFHSLALNTKGGPSTVMAGISEALVATALGLFVAIPAVAAYNYFVRKIKSMMTASENLSRLVATAYYSPSAVKKD
jgi:biopolymer transport protein ExbB/TolQ